MERAAQTNAESSYKCRLMQRSTHECRPVQTYRTEWNKTDYSMYSCTWKPCLCDKRRVVTWWMRKRGGGGGGDKNQLSGESGCWIRFQAIRLHRRCLRSTSFRPLYSESTAAIYTDRRTPSGSVSTNARPPAS